MKETPETKLCKHCKTQIPYAAKVCPNCRKRVKGGKGKWIVLAVIVAVIIAAVATQDNPRKVGEVDDSQSTTQGQTSPENESTTQPTQTTSPEKTQYVVGDILRDGDLEIVYIASGDYIEENQILQPEEGEKYIFLQFAFANRGESGDISISSFSFDCYADGYAAETHYWNEEDFSATLSPGRSTTGYICFAVPENAQEIEVEYTPNFFLSSEKIHFLFEGEKDSGFQYEPDTTPSQDAHQVGDVVESDNMKITYKGCEIYTSDNMFVKPKDGYQYISCTFEFENLSDSDQYITVYDFDCYADGLSCGGCYIRDDMLSATLSSGRKTSGTVTFEVPVDATVIEVEFLSNLWTGSRVIFNAKPQ